MGLILLRFDGENTFANIMLKKRKTRADIIQFKRFETAARIPDQLTQLCTGIMSCHLRYYRHNDVCLRTNLVATSFYFISISYLNKSCNEQNLCEKFYLLSFSNTCVRCSVPRTSC